MPQRGNDADSRIFFDQLVSLAVSRLRTTGAIKLEDRHGVIAFGEEDHGGERRKCIGVTHTKFPNGGSWSYFICPRCGGRKKKLWLVDDAPRCLNCCWALGVRYRSAYGFGRAERLSERDHYLDRVQARRLRGRKRRPTMTMRRSMIVCRLALLADQQKAKDRELCRTRRFRCDWVVCLGVDRANRWARGGLALFGSLFCVLGGGNPVGFGVAV
jgi:hypothetical protein